MTPVAERLRQERETFELAKAHAGRWFDLRLRIGYFGALLLLVIAAVCLYVILNPVLYATEITTWSMRVLGVDIVGQVIVILKVVLNPASMTKLAPVTALPSTTGSKRSLPDDIGCR